MNAKSAVRRTKPIKPTWQREGIQLYLGDCLLMLQMLAANSVHAIVTDPPAGIAFMGKEWDTDHGGRDSWIARMIPIAAECLRVLKPGGHAFVWALPRTSHWTATAWEDAGFEVRDRIGHIFGQGFPKSLDVSKAIDKALGAKRRRIRYIRRPGIARSWSRESDTAFDGKASVDSTPMTVQANDWLGWGTALKPAVEDWWLLRKPLDPTASIPISLFRARGTRHAARPLSVSRGTRHAARPLSVSRGTRHAARGSVAANVLKHGTGALNIDACRIQMRTGDTKVGGFGSGPIGYGGKDTKGVPWVESRSGRFPAHLIHDGSEEARAIFPASDVSGAAKKGYARNPSRAPYRGMFWPVEGALHNDSGSAARFFYCAKASKAERDAGLLSVSRGTRHAARPVSVSRGTRHAARNLHPTVKPLALMRYLCRLITPPGGIVLDPFCGSGSTGVAAVAEGFQFIGAESDREYFKIAKARIKAGRMTTANRTNHANRKEE